MSHLLGVTALVLEAGGDEDLAIGALLHDAAEDQGGEAMLREIGSRFGQRVQTIVAGCSDTFELPKPPWKERKRAYIEHVRKLANYDVSLVSAADKIHNARTILTDHHQIGDEVFNRFKASKEDTLWYYSALIPAFREAVRRNAAGERSGLMRLVNELESVVSELLERAEQGPQQTGEDHAADD
jgi:(p)ppGpp synthase/HD superfamily hydrolase